MPQPVIAAVNSALDGMVVSFGSASSGFSSGPAGRADLQDGRTVFVKGCSDELNPYSTVMHRKEAEILPRLRSDYPAPALITTVEVDDWIVLVTEYVEGETPVAPIGQEATAGVLRLVTTLAELGTPCPSDYFLPIGSEQGELETRMAWTAMQADGIPDTLDPWSRRHVSKLATLETDWIEAATGDALLHRDLRPDNMVLSSDGSGVAVDWPAASRGAPWVDLVGLLPSLEMLGGPTPDEVFDVHPVGKAADRAAVDSYLALLAGYFTGQSLLPPIQNVPGIREFQAAQAAVCRTWMSDRFGWDPPER